MRTFLTGSSFPASIDRESDSCAPCILSGALTAELKQARILDLFAGIGAPGLEALARGAAARSVHPSSLPSIRDECEVSARSCALLARANVPAAEPAAATANTGPTTTRFHRNPRSPDRETANTNVAASRNPPAAPHAAKRGSDISSNRRRPSARPNSPENRRPATNPAAANKRGKGASGRLPVRSTNPSATSQPAPPQAAAQVKPIPMAPRMRLNHFFISTSHATGRPAVHSWRRHHAALYTLPAVRRQLRRGNERGCRRVKGLA
jgi:hypothetical protein